MNTKKSYTKPEIERITLDTEISLILQSAEEPWWDPTTMNEVNPSDSGPFNG
ncbi:MAG: hypothetical protein PHQ26_10590 [Bacteroidales bacterium]|nr:hypothetical protein [Bacteroidales bacterium]